MSLNIRTKQNMSEPGVLHRSAEIEDLTHLTEQDKKNIEQEAQKGSDHLQSDQHITHSSLQNISKSSLHQENSDPN
ncbi:unnamed protein product [Adineta steineri]|uniref:Uncharacterized protein n=1 Tax=Adineta steineri TaxID=433720 RepID=A0A814ATN4_9BILA|nr:unnamed protein product [Adineta steineri]CAF0918259.1 unnamed protein product [Adineta steineri]CAF3478109.1 unnamed protein product [Adineta steineri]CAF3933106.1 unnamed protein product [Adineta steineri]